MSEESPLNPDNRLRYCNRCGTEYNPENQELPENASFYWVPCCPECKAKITSNVATVDWLNIISSDLGQNSRDYDILRDRIHAQARFVHGRLAGLSVEELVKRAKYFDGKQLNPRGKSYGPRRYRDIAFTLRKQAREKIIDD